MKFQRGHQKAEVHGEKARERKCQKPSVQQITEEEEEEEERFNKNVRSITHSVNSCRSKAFIRVCKSVSFHTMKPKLLNLQSPNLSHGYSIINR